MFNEDGFSVGRESPRLFITDSFMSQWIHVHVHELNCPMTRLKFNQIFKSDFFKSLRDLIFFFLQIFKPFCRTTANLLSNVYVYCPKNPNCIQWERESAAFFVLCLESIVYRCMFLEDPWQSMTINECIFHGCWMTHEYNIDGESLFKVDMSWWIILCMWNLPQRKKHE